MIQRLISSAWTPAGWLNASSRTAWLGALYTLFSGLRVAAYLPTMSSILDSGSSSQYSLWTWVVFCCANLSMALWLYDRAGHRLDRYVVVSAINAAMCGLVCLLIVGCRT